MTGGFGGGLTLTGGGSGGGHWDRSSNELTPKVSGDKVSVPDSGAESERFGADATAGVRGTAIGHGSTAGDDALAAGHEATAGADATAVGRGASAAGDHATALGRNASAGHAYSIALGSGATTTVASQFVAGSNAAPITTAVIGNGVTHASPGSATVTATTGQGTDIAGGALTLQGGPGTGSGSGGNVNFDTALAGSSGSSANTPATRARVRGDDGAFEITSNGRLRRGARSPSQITSDQTAYDLGQGSVQRLSTDAARTIHGFAAVDDLEALLINTGSNDLVLAHQSATETTAANRIITPDGADLTLEAGASAPVWYDTVTDRWRVLAA